MGGVASESAPIIDGPAFLRHPPGPECYTRPGLPPWGGPSEPRMNLHEYQAKELFSEYGIPVPSGLTAETPDEALAAARELGGDTWMVKAQAHTGGRGKAGGVLRARGYEELAVAARRLLGSRLVTAQSGPAGLPVSRVLIERPTAIGRELYLGMLVDRARGRVLIMASPDGGMDIEQVARETPARILSTPVQPAAGLQPWQARRLGFALGLDRDGIRLLARLLGGLYRLFLECDAGLVEINPLVITAEGGLVALDAKIHLDDNALYRHPALQALHDPSQEDPRELEAARHGLNYVRLDGTIGCMVNGAGLAMATMDLVKLHGAEPANFLDVGGTATAERVAEAFKLILSDRRVRAVLVNIFGGIVRCDLIAEGIVQAVRKVAMEVPVVVRLEGTNAERGLEILAASGLDLIAAEDLETAATQVVAAAGGARA